MKRRFEMLLISMLTAIAAPAWSAPPVWVSDDASLYLVDGATRTLVRTLPVIAKALAADGASGAWVSTSTELLHLDASAAIRLAVPLTSLEIGEDVQLASDWADDSVWIMDRHVVTHVGAAGQVLHRVTLPGDEHAIAIGVGTDRRVWALTKTSLIGLSADAVVQSQTRVASALGGPANGLAVDPLSPVVWVVREEEGGGNRRIVRVDASSQQPTTTSIDSPPLFGVAADAVAGGAWTLPAGGLHRYDAAGLLKQSVGLPTTSLGSARRIAVDQNTGALWVGHERGMSAMSSTGALLREIPTSGAIRQLSIGPSDGECAPH
jgi:hypothetical protein